MHQLVLRSFGKKAEFHWEKGCIVCGTNEDYEGLSNKQLYQVYSLGVYAGFVPIFLACIFFHPIYISLIAPYVVACHYDIKNMIVCRKNNYGHQT